MNFFTRKSKPLPLRPASPVVVTKKTLTESMDLIIEATKQGNGGLMGIMKHKRKGLELVHLDSLFSSPQKKVYTQGYIEEAIRTAIFMIKHASARPEMYELNRKFRGKGFYDLAVLALVTPVDVTGLVTSDENAYGWEVLATSASSVDFDFLVVDGEILTGTTAMHPGMLFQREHIGALRTGPSVKRNIDQVFKTISSKDLLSV